MRGDDGELHTAQAELVAWCHRPALTRRDVQVAIPQHLAARIVLANRVAVVDELTDVDARAERGQSPDMIAVEVRRNEIVDPVDVGVAHRSLDSKYIAVIGSRPPRVHQD